MWTQEEARVEGNYYHIQGAINQPKGVQRPHIPLLVGGKGEQATLKLVARYADACNFTHPSPEELTRKFALIKTYCDAIGRDDRQIRRTIFANGFIADTEEKAVAKVQSTPRVSLDHVCTRGLVGTPDTIRKRLREVEEMGVQEVIVFLRDVAHLEPLRLLALASEQ